MKVTGRALAASALLQGDCDAGGVVKGVKTKPQELLPDDGS
jgi:hypothetical protein